MVISVIGSRSRSNQYPTPDRMKAWVLGGPEELSVVEKPVPEPGPTEVLVRVDAIAVCATDIEIIRHGVPAMIDGGLPFVRRQGFRDNGLGKLREVLAHRVGDVMRPAAGAASGG